LPKMGDIIRFGPCLFRRCLGLKFQLIMRPASRDF
jgi:hypothetical protein